MLSLSAFAAVNPGAAVDPGAAVAPGAAGAAIDPGTALLVMHVAARLVGGVLMLLLFLPVLLAWLTETRRARAERWHVAGVSQAAIARRLGCSRRTVGRLLAGRGFTPVRHTAR